VVTQERRYNIVWWFSPLLFLVYGFCCLGFLVVGEIHRRGEIVDTLVLPSLSG